MIDIENWITQLHKGFLELSILIAIQKKQRSYGSQIIQDLKESGIQANEGTIYPIINRMYKNNWLNSYWQKSGGVEYKKRYYELTDLSKQKLPELISIYKKTVTSFEYLQEGSEDAILSG